MSATTTSADERQMKLALFVRQNGPVTRSHIQDALDEYAVTGTDNPESVRRMFERDKAALAEKGIVLTADENGAYSLDHEASTCLPLELSPAEASLLRMICMTLLKDPSYPFKDELRMTLVKMSDELETPDALPEWMGKRRNAEVGVAGKGPQQSAGTLRKIRTALEKHKTLQFDYVDAQGNSSRRSVEAIGSFSLDGVQYLACRDLDTDQRRTFRLDHMGKVNAGGPALSGECPAFRQEEWLFHSFQAGADFFEAQVLFGTGVAWKAEAMTAGKGTLEKRADGTVLWTIDAADEGKLASWCIQHGPGIQPVAPAAAAETYRTACKTLMEVA